MADLAWKHYYNPALALLKQILAIDEANYPESLKKMFVINTPGIFKFLWAIVKPMVDKKTLEKIVILGSNYYDTLIKHMPKESIPKEYGEWTLEADNILLNSSHLF